MSIAHTLEGMKLARQANDLDQWVAHSVAFDRTLKSLANQRASFGVVNLRWERFLHTPNNTSWEAFAKLADFYIK